MLELISWGLFIALFILIFAGVINNLFYFNNLRKLLNFLKEKHPEIWKALGEPNFFKLPFSPKKTLKIYRYINKEEYKNLGDEKLNFIASRTRKLLHFGILSVSLIAAIIFLSAIGLAIFLLPDNGEIAPNVIQVYNDEDLIGAVTVGAGGELSLDIKEEIKPFSDNLRKAIVEIQSRKSLKLLLEFPDVRDGELVQVLGYADILPADQRYIYAVAETLKTEFSLEARTR